MMPGVRWILAVCVGVVLCCGGPTHVWAQGTVFTYQGRLQDGGAPANGTYDLRLQAFDALSGGNAVSGLLTLQDVAVTNGHFTVPVALGAGVFTGDNRWLQLQVRPGESSSTFTALSPRQPILPTPYAIYSGNTNLLDGLDSTALARKSHTHGYNELTSPPLTISAAIDGGATVLATNSAATTDSVALRGIQSSSNGVVTGVVGETNSVSTGAYGILGRANSSINGSSAVGVRGINNATGPAAIGVQGSSAGSGVGVYGVTPSGRGVFGAANTGDGVAGSSQSGSGIKGNSETGIAGRFESFNGVALSAWSRNQQAALFRTASTEVAVDIFQQGPGSALRITGGAAGSDASVDIRTNSKRAGIYVEDGWGPAIEARSSSPTTAAILGLHSLGVGVIGSSIGSGNTAGVVGVNGANGVGVRGYTTSQGGIGILGQGSASGSAANIAGRFENTLSWNPFDVLQVETNGGGYALKVTNTNSSAAAKGVRIAMAEGCGANALTIANGNLVLTPQNGYVSGALPDNPVLRISTAGEYALPTTGVAQGTTVWIINGTTGGVMITNVEGGAFAIEINRAKQFIFYSGANWIATQ